MKLVTAIVQPDRLEPLQEALARPDPPGPAGLERRLVETGGPAFV